MGGGMREMGQSISRCRDIKTVAAAKKKKKKNNEAMRSVCVRECASKVMIGQVGA